MPNLIMPPKSSRPKRLFSSAKPVALRAGHGFRDKPREITYRGSKGAAHSLTLNPLDKERFVELAIRLRTSSTEQLARYTGVPLARVRQASEKLQAQGAIPEKSLKRRQIERMLIEGEKTQIEIAKATRSTLFTVRDWRHTLKERGIITSVDMVETPPAKIARICYRLMVLEQIGRHMNKIQVAAGQDISVPGLGHWFSRRPTLREEIKTLAGGKYWKKAEAELSEWKRKMLLGGMWLKTPKTQKILKLLIEGEKSTQEIAKETDSTAVAVQTLKYKAQSRGLLSWAFHTEIPPMKLARTYARLEALENAGVVEGKIIRACSGEIPKGTLNGQLGTRPQMIDEIKRLEGGLYWKKANRQIADWKDSLAEKYGKNEKLKPFASFDYHPSTLALVLLRLEVLRAVKPGAENAVRRLAEEGIVLQGEIDSWLGRDPHLFEKLSAFEGGRFIRRARSATGKWIKEQENFFGRKYAPAAA
jgi:hypothetical protein